MLHQAVVPQQKIAFAPRVLIDEFRLRGMFNQRREQRIALGVFHTGDARAVAVVDEEALLAVERMRAHDGVFDIGCTRFLLRRECFARAGVAFAVVAFFVGLHGFATGDFLLGGFGQCVVGGRGAGEFGVAQCFAASVVRHFKCVKQRAATWHFEVAKVGVPE